MAYKFNPYGFALSIIKQEIKDFKQILDTDVDSKTLQKLRNNIQDTGFDLESFWGGIKAVQESSFRKKRTVQQFSVGEILGCVRKGWLNRQGADYETQSLCQYPHGQIKAVLGHVVEQLSISWYQDITGIKIHNGKHIKWQCQQELGSPLPVKGIIDGYIYDQKTILEFKFTESASFMHKEQALLYALMLNRIEGIIVNKIEVIYVSNNLNFTKESITLIDKNGNFNEQTMKQFNHLIERIKLHSHYYNGTEMPPAEHDRCAFCPYETQCKNKEFTPNRQKVTFPLKTKNHSQRNTVFNI